MVFYNDCLIHQIPLKEECPSCGKKHYYFVDFYGDCPAYFCDCGYKYYEKLAEESVVEWSIHQKYSDLNVFSETENRNIIAIITSTIKLDAFNKSSDYIGGENEYKDLQQLYISMVMGDTKPIYLNIIQKR